MASRDKTALLSLQPYFIFFEVTYLQRGSCQEMEKCMKDISCDDGMEAARSNFPLSSLRVYTVYCLTYYTFSACIFTLFQLLPHNLLPIFVIFVLFSLCLLRFPRGQTLASKICYIDLMFLGVLVLSLTDETLGDITTLSTVIFLNHAELS